MIKYTESSRSSGALYISRINAKADNEFQTEVNGEVRGEVLYLSNENGYQRTNFSIFIGKNGRPFI